MSVLPALARLGVFALAVMLATGAASGCGDTPGSNGKPPPANIPPWWRGTDPELIRCPLGSTALQVESQIIVPRCGAPGDGSCHATGPIPPRFAEAGMIAQNLIDVAPELRCARDKFVSRADPAQSDVLTKIRARGSSARCSDGSDGGPGMPYQDAPQLTADEAACLEWWVHEIVK